MTDIRVVPFKPEHLEQLKAQPSQQGEIPKIVMTTALTFMVGDTPIAIFGGFFFAKGVTHIWGLLSEDIQKFPITFHKTCQKVLSFFEARERSRRIQIDVREDYPRGCRWAEALGFKREGLMHKYAKDGANCYLYAKVVE